MRRFLVLLTGALAALVLTAATASANHPTYTLSLTATPSTLVAGDVLGLSGTLGAMPNAAPVAGYDVAISVYDEETCSAEPYVFDETLTTADDGSYGGDVYGMPAGTYYFQASVELGDAYVVSPCVPVTVTPVQVVPSDTIASSFLCWNHDMVNPVAYIDKVADQMWQTGNYFEPQAILGNVEGGTNIGAYHLVCNAPSTMKPTGSGLGSSGEVYSPEMMQAYHHDHAGGNDLNVYHIYK